MLRKALFATITVVISTVIALIIGELFLVVYSSQQTDREHMDPGLVRYHSRYGWNLTPGWQGRHTHPDYDVSYRIDHRGFRAEKGAERPSDDTPLTLVVGDSFTFGLGVEDHSTYVARLNQRPGARRYLNAAVPGYSPEQALLKAEDLAHIYQPAALWFVVYLGNDLVDLGLPFAVQAEYAKPYATIASGNWTIENQPVPTESKPADLRARTLSSYIVSTGSQSQIARFKFGQLLIENRLWPDTATINRQQLEQSMTLLNGLLDRLEMIPVSDLQLLLLPGSGPVDRKGSLSADYQEMLNERILQVAALKGISAISLLDILKETETELYYPLDGHLTARGHQVVADYLLQHLAIGHQLTRPGKGIAVSGPAKERNNL